MKKGNHSSTFILFYVVMMFLDFSWLQGCMIFCKPPSYTNSKMPLKAYLSGFPIEVLTT